MEFQITIKIWDLKDNNQDKIKMRGLRSNVIHLSLFSKFFFYLHNVRFPLCNSIIIVHFIGYFSFWIYSFNEKYIPRLFHKHLIAYFNKENPKYFYSKNSLLTYPKFLAKTGLDANTCIKEINFHGNLS